MICANCHYDVPRTEIWVGDGGLLAWNHGLSSHWCPLCVVTAQLEYAKARSAEIPALEAKRGPLLEERRQLVKQRTS